MFHGSITALITPFAANGAVDEAALQALVEWQISCGTHGLVPCGTTGESPTLTHEEHKRVVELVVEAAGRRVPVMAGTGSNSTTEAIELTRHAKACGADGALVVTPYYNKPTQAGLVAHFAAIAEAVEDLPLFIYNIPARSVIDMQVSTMAALAKAHSNIAGVKDATADIMRVSHQKQACGADFIQLSGEDPTALGFMTYGGHGCISVAANVVPDLCAQFQNACMAGDYAKAGILHEQLMPLHISLFMENNPGGVKYALHRLGKSTQIMRLPLVEISAINKEAIDVALKDLGLIS